MIFKCVDLRDAQYLTIGELYHGFVREEDAWFQVDKNDKDCTGVYSPSCFEVVDEPYRLKQIKCRMIPVDNIEVYITDLNKDCHVIINNTGAGMSKICSVLLDKERAILLRDELTNYIEGKYDSTN